MEQSEAIEGNKILVYFEFDRKDLKIFRNKTGMWFNGRFYTWSLLPYSTSFDWIIRLWIKFKSLQFNNITDRHYHKQVCASFGNGILSGDIDNAWADAVMAIKWYNQIIK